MIKKLKFEIFLLSLLILNIFFFKGIDRKTYKIFNSFDIPTTNSHLKNFFINITEIGDSIWVFALCFFIYLFNYFLKKNSKKKLSGHNLAKSFSLFLFIGTLITGITTQLIKHVVGRARPSYVDDTNLFDFSVFSFESAFHSFPSGHTSTIFFLALTFSMLTPNIKYFYLFFAGIVAVSRVMVGAHFFTDILGGMIIAFIGIKLTTTLFYKLKLEMPFLLKINSNIFLLSTIVFFISIIFLSIGSSFDIYLSGLFYEGKQTFFLQSFDNFTIFIRKFFLYFLILYLILFPSISWYFSINIIYLNNKLTLKDVIFIFLSFVFNLVIVINLLLKNFWGRARPNDIVELGGGEIFTPWFVFSDACEKNCSFVSGDSAAGFSIIILFFLTKNKFFFWLSIISGVLIGSTRILEGGHFVSDVLFSGLLIFVLSYFEYYIYKKYYTNVK